MNKRQFLWVLSLVFFTVGASAEKQTDLVYGHKDGMALVMDVYEPDSNANGAAVAFIISGGFMSSLPMQAAYETMFMPLVDAGFTVFAVRHGSSPRYLLPEIYSDVSQAFQFIGANASQFNVDPQRIGVAGISAGGHLSLMLGLSEKTAEGNKADYRPAAVVAYMPPTDVRPIVGPSESFPSLNFDAALAPQLSPITFVSSDDPPVLLVHGDADELVNISNSESMHSALQEAKVTTEFMVIAGAPHGLFTGEDKKTVDSALVNWFQEYLL